MPPAVPFVGREDELRLLADSVRKGTAAGGPAAAVVVGEPGSGKSRLLEEALRKIDSVPIHWVRGTEIERNVPLAAASELLRTVQEPSAKSPVSRSDLRDGAGLNPISLFEDVHRRLHGHPAGVLAVDDLQWIDELTLALLSYLIRGAKASRLPLVVLAAARPSPSTSAFIDLLRRALPDREAVEEIELGHLPKEKGIELISHLEPNVDHQRASAIWEKAAGSPFWMGILASSGESQGSARGLVIRRLRGLTDDAKRMMALLSVATRALPLVVAGEVLRLTAEGSAQAKRELIDRGLIVETDRGLAPAHDLIRDAAAGALPAELAKELRTEFARWIESDAGSDVQPLWEALEHREAAGSPLLDLALRIVDAPGRRMIGESGVNRLLRIAETEGLSNPEGLLLHQRLAELASEVGERETSRKLWLTVAAAPIDASGKARAYFEAARVAFEQQKSKEVSESLAKAREYGQADGTVLLDIDVLDALRLRWIEGKLPEAKELTLQAETRARSMAKAAGRVDLLSASERRAYSEALRARFDVAVIEQDISGSAKLAEEMMGASTDSPQTLVRAMLDSALVLMVRGRWDDAENWLRRSWLSARREILPASEAEAGFWLAQSLYLMGRLDEGRVVAQEAMELGERVGIVPVRISLSWIRSLPHLIDLSRANWRDALGRLQQVLSSESDPHYRLRLRWQVALWSARLFEQDARDEVARQIDEGSKDAQIAGCDRCVTEFTFRAAEALVRTGDLKRAGLVLAEWDEGHSSTQGAQSFWRQRTDTLADAAHQRSASALDALREKALQQGLLFELVWIDLDRARTQDSDLAPTVYAEAAELAEKIGAMTEQSIAEQALRALGVRSRRRGPKREGGPLPPLSKRELEVARLVAGGSSNPEIAETLFLSRKTVERHVSNILAKLHLRNRTELATRLAASEDPVTAENAGVPR